MKLKQAALLYGSVGWKVFPIKPGAKNPPLVKWGDQSSNSPAEINAWWDRSPQANVGLACGQSGLAVIDIDVKDGRRGRATLELLEVVDGVKLSPTRMQRTPSGGLQYFYRGVIPTSQNVIGKSLWPDGISHIDTRGVGGAGGYVLLPPSETIANAASHTKAGMYEWINGATFPIAPLDQWVIDLFAEYDMLRNTQEQAQEPVVDETDANVKWFEEYVGYGADDLADIDAPIAIEGQGGELRTLTRVAGVAKDKGLLEETAFDKMYHSLWNARCQPPWDYDELRVKVHNAYSYLKQNKPGEDAPEHQFSEKYEPPATKTPAELVADRKLPADKATPSPPTEPEPEKDEGEFSEFKDNDEIIFDEKPAPSPWQKAIDRLHERDRVARERIWTFPELCADWIYIAQMDRFIYEVNPNLILKPQQFDRLFAYAKPDGAQFEDCKSVSACMFQKATFTCRRPMRAVFAPGEPPGMIDGGESYNLWRTPPVVPKAGDTTLWDDHLVYLFPEQADRDLVLNWMAWLLQNLDLKPKHALLIAGYLQGTGKSYLSEVLMRILGEDNCSPVGSVELSSAFNKWAHGSKLLWIEELDALEKNVIKHTLHPIITQEVIPINDKGIATYKARNCFGILANTNEDAALRLSRNDRRYLVVRTVAIPKHQHYYADLYSVLDDNEALGAIAYQLLNRDIGEYNGQARAPDTAAKAEMVLAGMSDLEQWMHDNKGTWPLSGRVVCVDDIISLLPGRLERLPRLHNNISTVLMHSFRGVRLGQTRFDDGGKISLWAINGCAIDKIEGADFGAIYLLDKARRGAAADKQAEKDFAE